MKICEMYVLGYAREEEGLETNRDLEMMWRCFQGWLCLFRHSTMQRIMKRVV